MTQQDKKQNRIKSKLVGLLVHEELSAKEVIKILDNAKDTYLERSYHISLRKKAD